MGTERLTLEFCVVPEYVFGGKFTRFYHEGRLGESFGRWPCVWQLVNILDDPIGLRVRLCSSDDFRTSRVVHIGWTALQLPASGGEQYSSHKLGSNVHVCIRYVFDCCTTLCLMALLTPPFNSIIYNSVNGYGKLLAIYSPTRSK